MNMDFYAAAVLNNYERVAKRLQLRRELRAVEILTVIRVCHSLEYELGAVSFVKNRAFIEKAEVGVSPRSARRFCFAAL